MNDKPRRRWFRFSLRTLLVVVTLMGVWLGWVTSVVRERRAALQEIRANPAYFITTAETWAQRYPPASTPSPWVQPPARISLVRTWLGDEAIQDIAYSWYPAPTPAELDRWKRIFPEADVRELPAEPCHPGCFPRGTLVETPDGPRSIERIVAGDFVISVLPGGESTSLEVQSVFVTENRLWMVQTDAGELLTTATQPLCLACRANRAAEELQPGDEILRCDEGQVRAATVRQVRDTGRIEQVFNVVLGDCEPFVAGGFLVRSKPPLDATVPAMREAEAK